MGDYFDEIRFEIDYENFYRVNGIGDLVGIKKMIARKLPIIFGSLRHHWKYFWTTDDVNDINDFYHDKLVEKNGFPIQALDFFSPKQYRPTVANYFFEDCSGDGEFLLIIVQYVKYNHRALEEIINRGLSIELKDEVDVYYNGISEYLEDEAKKGNLESLPESYSKTRFKRPYDEYRTRDEEVYNDALFSVYYVDLFDDPSSTNKRIIKDIDGSRLSGFEVKENGLLPSSLKLLKERIKGIDEADLQTCLNLLENYQCFVEKKDHEKFNHEFEKSQLSLNSLYEETALESARRLIKKYYSDLAVAYLMNDLTESQKAKIAIEFRERFRHGEEWLNPYRICFFIDCLSYCFKKGFVYLEKEGYCKLNAIMRHVSRHYATRYWYCFDPRVAGQWTMLSDYHVINDRNCEEFRDALKAIVEQNIIIRNSPLFLDVFKIACEQDDFKVAITMIRDAIEKRAAKNKKK